jgi:flagellar hook-associated protein 2
MAGTVNSLGIGSGVLTADVIDKLKENERASTVTPIEDKIKLNQQKTDALALLDSLMSSFKSSASALSDDTIFANRSVSGNIDGINVTADKGVDIQSFSITDTSLAKQNILESSSFSDPSDTIALGNGKLNFNVDGTDYVIDYTNSTTLENLKTSINSVAGTDLEASILQTDEDSYELIVKSKNTGQDQTISIIDLTGNLKDDSLLTDNVASGSFSSSSSKVSSGSSGTMDITLGDNTYKFSYNSNTTLSQMASQINDNSDINSQVTASVVKYGDSDYRLVITPKLANADNNILITDSGSGLSDALKSDALASDASFSSKDALIANDGSPDSTGSFRVSIGGVDYDFAYDETTTLQDLAESINADSSINDKVNADIVKYGDGDYRLVLSNTATTQNQSITTSDQVTQGAGLVANLAGGTYTDASSAITDGSQKTVQDAKDASFKYNGITLTRSTNEITDIAPGLTITLSQEGKSSNFSITQDTTAISDELNNLANSYNTLMDELNNMTTSDVDEGTVGIFNGDNSINGIRREINSIITKYNSDGMSLTQFGIDLNESGKMSFNKSDFESKFQEDISAAQLFFSGSTTVDDNGLATYTDGIFDDLNNLLGNYTNSSGYLDNMQTGYKSELDNLEGSHTHSLDLLNARYDTMTQQFIEYDAIINRLNSQFSVLDSMIQAELK